MKKKDHERYYNGQELPLTNFIELPKPITFLIMKPSLNFCLDQLSLILAQHPITYLFPWKVVQS